MEYLNDIGFRAERKAIYRDIEVLNEFGIHIAKGPRGFYYDPKQQIKQHLWVLLLNLII